MVFLYFVSLRVCNLKWFGVVCFHSFFVYVPSNLFYIIVIFHHKISRKKHNFQSGVHTGQLINILKGKFLQTSFVNNQYVKVDFSALVIPLDGRKRENIPQEKKDSLLSVNEKESERSKMEKSKISK